jgi:hypothetical protein
MSAQHVFVLLDVLFVWVCLFFFVYFFILITSGEDEDDDG